MDAITFNIYATYIVPPTVLIPIALALINYRYLTNPLKVIFGFLVF
ncbi:MAG: hypothetical protein JWP37_2523, partial [Mucilaginibacter sp.]|nr:hypothetical protein [Mucilaginibacter sp.]